MTKVSLSQLAPDRYQIGKNTLMTDKSFDLIPRTDFKTSRRGRLACIQVSGKRHDVPLSCTWPALPKAIERSGTQNLLGFGGTLNSSEKTEALNA
jgi:hypothetical protein